MSTDVMTQPIDSDQIEDNEITIRQRITAASGIFVNPKPSAQKIAESLAELQACLEWARERRMVDLQTDALWGIYLCRSRSNVPSAGADRLLALRALVEEARRGIADPVNRGGAFSTYPALCEKLHAAGRIDEMFEAIEANKGRGIADLLTRSGAPPVADADVYGAVKRIPALCTKFGFHYLTYLVDAERAYAVLVTRRGRLIAPEPIPLSREAIRAAAARVNPRAWGRTDVSKLLSPLVAWLAPLLADHTIAPDDHICISADDDLANVPFTYLWLGKRRLTDILSTSRIQNAFHLATVLARQPLRPTAFLGVAVPFKQNVSEGTWDLLRAALHMPLDYLGGRLPGEILKDRMATCKALQAIPRRDMVVHFSTHGIFARPERDETPFDHAGLVLANGKSLPDADDIDEGKLDTVLTPRRILEGKVDFAGSHVSMMSCVSGLSREGIGGDALGMDWAIIQARAASVLSSHWEVDADVAAEFLTTFYRCWLEEGLARREAMDATIVEFRAKGGRYRDAESWAAFSLTGDWR